MARRLLKRIGVTLIVLAALWALWEAYRAIWMATGWTRPFVVDDLTMPPMHDIVGRLFEPLAEGTAAPDSRPPRQERLHDARRPLAGFLLGAVIGFTIGVVLHHSRLLRRGFLPYVVASQTVPDPGDRADGRDLARRQRPADRGCRSP